MKGAKKASTDISNDGLLASMLGRSPVENELFEKALSYSVQVAGRWTKSGEVFIPSIEPGMSELDEAITSIWVRKGPDPEAESQFSHYAFPDWEWKRWSAYLCASMRHRELIFERVGYNLMQGKPIPEGFRIIAGAHLMGQISPLPPKQGKKTLRHRDTLIVGIAKRVSTDFGYPVGANKATFRDSVAVPKCGCAFAAAALHAWNVHVTAKRANDICATKGLPVEKAVKAAAFEPHHLFIKNALMNVGPDLESLLSSARNFMTRT